MAFNNEIRVLNTTDTNHADNFNEPLQELLENTQFNAKQIGVLRGYTSPKLIDQSLSVTSNIVDIMTILGADGNLNGCYVEKASGNNYPATYGKITTSNNGNGRTIIYEAYLNAKKELYYAVVAYADSVTVTDWIKLSTSDEITALQGATVGLGFSSSCVQLNTVGVTDIHEITKTPYRRCFGLDLTNAPSKGFYFYEIMVHSVGYATVRATGFGDGEAIKATFTNELLNGIWRGWKELATTDKIDISLTLLNQFKQFSVYENKASRTNNIVTVQLSLDVSTAVVADGTPIAVLPQEFRPKSIIPHCVLSSRESGVIGNVLVNINTDGSIAVCASSFKSTQEFVVGTITYMI